MTKQEHDKAMVIFKKLVNECKKKDSYSVEKACSKIGLDYEQMKKLAEKNKSLNPIFYHCKDICLNNIELASLKGEIEWEEFVRTSVENSYEGHYLREYHLKELEKLEREKGTWGVIMITEQKKELEVIEPETQDKKNVNDSLYDEHLTAEKKIKHDELLKPTKKQSRLKYIVEEPKPGTFIGKYQIKHDNNLTETEKKEIINRENLDISGSENLEFSTILINQTVNGFCKSDTSDTGQIANLINAAHNTLFSLAPNDEFEAMLISRSLVLHNQYMHYMQLAANMTNQDMRDRHINNATKLMRVYNESLEALNKYRRKGEQKVTVQHNHVHVNDGGKAIVGSEINGKTGVGEHDKK